MVEAEKRKGEKKQIREEDIKSKHRRLLEIGDSIQQKNFPLVGLSKSLQQSSGPRLKCEEHSYTNLSLVVFIWICCNYDGTRKVAPWKHWKFYTWKKDRWEEKEESEKYSDFGSKKNKNPVTMAQGTLWERGRTIIRASSLGNLLWDGVFYIWQERWTLNISTIGSPKQDLHIDKISWNANGDGKKISQSLMTRWRAVMAEVEIQCSP